MKIYLFTLLCFLITSISEAKDFGIEGHSFKIIEADILKVIEQRLSEMDLEKLNQQMQEATKAYVERPKEATGIVKALVSKVFYYDPSYQLKEDIYDHNHNLIYPKGTRVNPLSHIPLREELVFINGDDQNQVDMALLLRKQKNNKLKIILVKGSPLKIQRKHKIWIYFDQAGFITGKFGIKEIPTIVSQDGLKLKINVIGEDN